MKAVIAVVNGQRTHGVTCPHCGSKKAMPNPVEHTRDARPHLCMACGKSYTS